MCYTYVIVGGAYTIDSLHPLCLFVVLCIIISLIETVAIAQHAESKHA